MAACRVLVVDHAWPDLDIEQELLSAAEVELVAVNGAGADQVLRHAPTADAIMVNWAPLPRPVLAAATRCRTVARFGVGVDNIDVDAATELGILVTRVTDYCIDEVAEHTIALLLALRRKIVAFAGQTRAGGWDNAAFGPMHRIRGTTMGVVGWGPIGQAVAALALGLGMRVEVYSQPAPQEDGLPPGVRLASSLAELASHADHLSVHVPLTGATAGLISEPVLRLMRPSAVVLNAARGPIVDTRALAEAIREGRIAGAGIDVLDADPPSRGNPLLALDNVVVTPHAAFNSVESIQALRRQATGNVLAVLEGRSPSSIANPEVLDHPAPRFRRPEAPA